MREQDFQTKVVDSLARIEEKLTNVCKETDGHERTLYGEDGRGGLVKDVEANRSRQNLWNKGLALLTVLIGGAVAWLKWGVK